MDRRGAAISPGALRRRQDGFTLIELLLVIGVAALIAGLLLPGLAGIFRTMEEVEPERVLWNAITAARDRALVANREVSLRFDRRSNRLAWSDGDVGGSKDWQAEVELRFLRPNETAKILVGGQLMETSEVRSVRFYPDGTCDRFRAQIQSSKLPVRVLAIDPWTCAPVLPAPPLP